MLSFVKKRVDSFRKYEKDLFDAEVAVISIEKFFDFDHISKCDPVSAKLAKDVTEKSRKIIDHERSRCIRIYKVLNFFGLM